MQTSEQQAFELVFLGKNDPHGPRVDMSSSISKSRSKKSKISPNEHRSLMYEKYKHVPGFFISENAWSRIWQDPYWYTSVLLEIGFIGLFVAAFISILQIENVISKAWVFWICAVIQAALMGIHTLVYGYYHLNQIWSEDLSLPQLARIRTALIIMWCALILVVTMTSVFTMLPEVPGCCTQDIIGLTTGPINVYLVVQWQMIMLFSCVLLFGAGAENFVAIASLLYPERMVHDFATLVKLEKSMRYRNGHKSTQVIQT